MLTSRLQVIRNTLRSQIALSQTERELLEIINRLNVSEENIARAFNSDSRELLVEMIVKPGGKECSICGRTLNQ